MTDEAPHFPFPENSDNEAVDDSASGGSGVNSASATGAFAVAKRRELRDQLRARQADEHIGGHPDQTGAGPGSEGLSQAVAPYTGRHAAVVPESVAQGRRRIAEQIEEAARRQREHADKMRASLRERSDRLQAEREAAQEALAAAIAAAEEATAPRELASAETTGPVTEGVTIPEIVEDGPAGSDLADEVVATVEQDSGWADVGAGNVGTPNPPMAASPPMTAGIAEQATTQGVPDHVGSADASLSAGRQPGPAATYDGWPDSDDGSWATPAGGEKAANGPDSWVRGDDTAPGGHLAGEATSSGPDRYEPQCPERGRVAARDLSASDGMGAALWDGDEESPVADTADEALERGDIADASNLDTPLSPASIDAPPGPDTWAADAPDPDALTSTAPMPSDEGVNKWGAPTAEGGVEANARGGVPGWPVLPRRAEKHRSDSAASDDGHHVDSDDMGLWSGPVVRQEPWGLDDAEAAELADDAADFSDDGGFHHGDVTSSGFADGELNATDMDGDAGAVQGERGDEFFEAWHADVLRENAAPQVPSPRSEQSGSEPWGNDAPTGGVVRFPTADELVSRSGFDVESDETTDIGALDSTAAGDDGETVERSASAEMVENPGVLGESVSGGTPAELLEPLGDESVEQGVSAPTGGDAPADAETAPEPPAPVMDWPTGDEWVTTIPEGQLGALDPTPSAASTESPDLPTDQATFAELGVSGESGVLDEVNPADEVTFDEDYPAETVVPVVDYAPTQAEIRTDGAVLPAAAALTDEGTPAATVSLESDDLSRESRQADLDAVFGANPERRDVDAVDELGSEARPVTPAEAWWAAIEAPPQDLEIEDTADDTVDFPRVRPDDRPVPRIGERLGTEAFPHTQPVSIVRDGAAGGEALASGTTVRQPPGALPAPTEALNTVPRGGFLAGLPQNRDTESQRRRGEPADAPEPGENGRTVAWWPTITPSDETNVTGHPTERLDALVETTAPSSDSGLPAVVEPAPNPASTPDLTPAIGPTPMVDPVLLSDVAPVSDPAPATAPRAPDQAVSVAGAQSGDHGEALLSDEALPAPSSVVAPMTSNEPSDVPHVPSAGTDSGVPVEPAAGASGDDAPPAGGNAQTEPGVAVDADVVDVAAQAVSTADLDAKAHRDANTKVEDEPAGGTSAEDEPGGEPVAHDVVEPGASWVVTYRPLPTAAPPAPQLPPGVLSEQQLCAYPATQIGELPWQPGALPVANAPLVAVATPVEPPTAELPKVPLVSVEDTVPGSVPRVHPHQASAGPLQAVEQAHAEPVQAGGDFVEAGTAPRGPDETVPAERVHGGASQVPLGEGQPVQVFIDQEQAVPGFPQLVDTQHEEAQHVQGESVGDGWAPTEPRHGDGEAWGASDVDGEAAAPQGDWAEEAIDGHPVLGSDDYVGEFVGLDGAPVGVDDPETIEVVDASPEADDAAPEATQSSRGAAVSGGGPVAHPAEAPPLVPSGAPGEAAAEAEVVESEPVEAEIVLDPQDPWTRGVVPDTPEPWCGTDADTGSGYVVDAEDTWWERQAERGAVMRERMTARVDESLAATKRRGAQWLGNKRVWVLLLVVGLLAVAGLVGVAVDALRSSGESAPVMPPVGETAAVATTAIVVTEAGAQTEVVQAAVVGAAPGVASVMVVPQELSMGLPGASQTPLGLVDGPAQALEDVLRVRVDATWVLGKDDVVALVDAAGGVPVQVTAAFEAQGEVVAVGAYPALTGEQVWAYAASRRQGESAQAQSARWAQVVVEVLRTLPEGDEAVLGTVRERTGEGLLKPGPEVLSWAGAAVRSGDYGTMVVPTTVLDYGGGDSVLVVDEDAAQGMLESRFVGAYTPVDSSATRVLVQNGYGAPGLVVQARRRLNTVAGVQVTAAGNAIRLQQDTSAVLVPNDSEESREVGYAIAEALGVPATAVMVATEAPTVVDVMVVLGRDFHDAVGGDADANADGGTG